jgi:hypothetical protein
MPSFYLRPSLVTLTSANYLGGTPLILSDHGRAPLNMSYERIETRDRMANGTMRSYFIADKRTFELSWQNLPSRATGPSGIGQGGSTRLTSDGYAGANDLRAFYEAATGPFDLNLWIDEAAIPQWSDLPTTAADLGLDVYFASFASEVTKRGTYFDLVNVSMTLEQA